MGYDIRYMRRPWQAEIAHNCYLQRRNKGAKKFIAKDEPGSLTDHNFSGMNFRSADFSYADLSGCTFKRANLRNADFTKTNLTGADFRRALVSGALFTGAILVEAKGLLVLAEAGVDLSECDLIGYTQYWKEMEE